MAAMEGVRATTWRAIFWAVASYAVCLCLANVAYPGSLERALGDLETATNGWLGRLLVLPLPTLVVVVLVILCGGGLRPADIGWRASAIVPAALATLLFWGAVQGALLLVMFHEGGTPTWCWRSQRFDGSALGILVNQLVGVALLEETFFRGYLLPQVFLRLAPVSSKGVAWGCASLDSVALFVLSHVETLQLSGVTGHELAPKLLWVLEFGGMMTLVFLATGNVFLCVGLHALWNARPMLFETSTERVDLAWWIGAAVILLAAVLARTIRSRARVRLQAAMP